MVKITNPTNEKLEVIYQGTPEALEAKEERIVSDSLATFWKGIHEFLIVSEAITEKTKKVIDDVMDKLDKIEKGVDKVVVKEKKAVEDKKANKENKSKNK